MSTTIKFKRGTISVVEAHLLEIGEPAFATDTQELYIGDGTTYGGVFIGPADITDITPTTTKGDIIVDNGVNASRFPLGTNGQVLTVDTTKEFGIKWA